MRLLFLLFLIGISPVLLGTAQTGEKDRLWSFPLTAEPGETAVVTYVQESDKNGEVSVGTVTAQLSIQEEAGDGFIATWQVNSIKVGDAVIDVAHPQAASMYIGIPFQFVAGFDGEPLRLYDREQLLLGMAESPAFEEYDPAVIQSVIEIFSSMTDEALASTFIKVPYLMSICQATSLPLSETVESRGEVANPFGGRPLTGISSYTLESIEQNTGTARIVYESGYDQDSMRAVVIDMFQRLAPDKTPTDEEINQTMIVQSSSAVCDVDMRTGWVTDMKVTNAVQSGGDSQSEHFSISVSWRE